MIITLHISKDYSSQIYLKFSMGMIKLNIWFPILIKEDWKKFLEDKTDSLEIRFGFHGDQTLFIRKSNNHITIDLENITSRLFSMEDKTKSLRELNKIYNSGKLYGYWKID